MKYDEYQLGDLIDLLIDNRGITPTKKGGAWSESGYRVLSAKNVKTGILVNEDSMRCVDEELYRQWMPNEIKRFDIIVTSEAPCGEIYLWDSDEKIVLGQRLFGLRCNSKVDPKYLYTYMCGRVFQGELKNRNSGTTVQGIRQKELVKCNVKVPSIDDQRKVSKVLYDLESKVSIIRRINDNLGGTCLAS